MTEDLSWLPDLFVAGVPKAGTSSVHRWIADHPGALGSAEKETCFFADTDSHIYRPGANVRGGWAAYRPQFALPEGPRPRVIFESTPSYIYQRTALDEIPSLPGTPRCLFILREPADQIRSIYRYFRNNWTFIPAEMSFAAYLDAIRAGSHDFGGNELAQDALRNARYLPHLQAWRERLGTERMMVRSFDALRADPRGLMREVASWAGLDPAFYDDYDFPSENETYVPRSRALHRLNVAVRARLPRGAIYRSLRGLYRGLNTESGRTAGQPDAEEAETLAALRASFAADNLALARAFDLDLPGWAMPPADQPASTVP
ncbi:sulfotransferase domain-containing protein [Roseisalinus antarcticus]|uniref:Sulfotransferase domain protein n=1 Tax=Roseisalinus antarcticus TaxID=254357 RepID=A0A1Y5TKU5_9RHOB|nr:sulfotransferase domain-containing protein [Roseisalinus antarcticus]SLN64377.1 Sulfotransferase domain protein [Roseisalinus antarcticus]